MLPKAYLSNKNIKYNYNLCNSRTQLAYLVLFMYKKFEAMKHFIDGNLVDILLIFLFVSWEVCI